MPPVPRRGLVILVALTVGALGFGAALAMSRQDAGTSKKAVTPPEGRGVADAGSVADAGTVVAPPRELPGAVSRARVFFSGHSLLDNPLPDFVELIASGLGQDMRWNQQNIIGSPIRVRTWGNVNWEGYKQGKNRGGTNLDVLRELQEPQTLGPSGQRYDTLVITERHDILGTLQWEDTVRFLLHFHNHFVAANPQGKTYFYQTWLDIPKEDPSPWMEYERLALLAWECAASKVNLTLESDGRADRVIPLPGSAALVDLVEQVLAGQVSGLEGSTPQRLNAIFSDDVHLTPLGAYYLAAVHYASIFRRSPEGAPGAPGVERETVLELQSIAWRFVSRYYAQPGAGVQPMEVCRRRIAEELCPALSKLQEKTEQHRGLKKLVSGALRARDIHRCRSFFGDARAEGNPFVWPDPKAKLPPKP